MSLLWQQYALLGLLAYGLIAIVYNSYHLISRKYTFRRVILGLTIQAVMASLVLSIGTPGFAGIALLIFYGLNALSLISQIGQEDEPAEPGGEMTFVGVIVALLAWAVLSLA